MRYFSKLFIAFTLLSGAHMFSQSDESTQEPSLDAGTINSQFEYIYQKSGNYRADGKRYEVVRTLNLDKLRENVKDTLNAANQKASQLQQVITSQENTIASLNSKLEETTKNLTAVTEEKDSMSLLGAQVSKATYNVTLWTLILGLFLLLLLFIFKFRQSNVLTQEAKSSLADLETEYEDHRRRALEREQRISRQLQDEINKYRKSK
ncbi:tRNA (guanine-N1)-methyltransferase [Muriicola soli]|uniref:tRNA (Guanine-N1)-methyltransferase n=1 Tax=Muriicola soli TaxID=2507538 RepID=A0A411EA34_9FLAO|nr:tRNA (guanine-N1)-methyltransferase [Muriicola soli]QBA64394.1 tRNA (guanine-N1)-methyltransferase [Muriicola soli]